MSSASEILYFLTRDACQIPCTQKHADISAPNDVNELAIILKRVVPPLLGEFGRDEVRRCQLLPIQ